MEHISSWEDWYTTHFDLSEDPSAIVSSEKLTYHQILVKKGDHENF